MVAQQVVVRLYDGEDKVTFPPLPHVVTFVIMVQTSFDSGTLQLTNHRLIWDDEEQEVKWILTMFPFKLPSVITQWWCI